MKRTIILREPGLSNWTSCNTLLENIIAAYTLSYPGEIKVFKSTELSAIVAYRPEVVIICDHRSNFEHSVGAIKYSIDTPIEWIIHAYGCFVSRIGEFAKAHLRMESDTFKILTGSFNHKRIVENLFQDPDVVVGTHFPFNEKHARFSSEVSSKTRNRLGINGDEYVFVYSGRISYQKNVHHIFPLLQSLAKASKAKIHFLICGSVDELNPKHNPHGPPNLKLAGELFSSAMQACDPSSVRVQHLGNLTQEALFEVLQASDRFISLSTHLGEDYGLAVAEALATGLPALLSPWGGYKDYQLFKQVDFCELKLGPEDVKQFSIPGHVGPLKRISSDQRQENFDQFLSIYGIKAYCQNGHTALATPTQKIKMSKLAHILFEFQSMDGSLKQKVEPYLTQLLAPLSDSHFTS